MSSECLQQTHRSCHSFFRKVGAPSVRSVRRWLPHSKTLQARPGLIFRASSRFVSRDYFVGTEKRRQRYFFALGKMGGNGFQVFLVKAHAADRHSAAGIDQKNRGDVGQAISIGNRIVVFVEKQREGRAVFLGKILGGTHVVLRDSEKTYGIAAITFVEAFEERECELADGAGDFEEGGYDGTALQQGVERVFHVVERFQRKSRSDVSGNDVRHVVLFSHPA